MSPNLSAAELRQRIFGRQGSTSTMDDTQVVLNAGHSAFSTALYSIRQSDAYLYAFFLALLSVAAAYKRATTAAWHLTIVLLSAFAVYAYRDLWPLATFTLTPLDKREGPLLWAKIAALGIASILIPLTIPRKYIPLDPKEPSPVPNAEQTAPILSLALYTFLDPIIFLANRVPHLSHDQLPPIADYDRAKNLVQRSFKHLDVFSGSPRRHLFFSFLKVFSREYIALSFLLCVKVLTGFFGPVGINRLLAYLETHGEGAVVRPWVWISCLLLGPLVGSLAWQWYIFIGTSMLVRIEGIVTQLVFEHALRIRMKAETAKSAASTASTPDSRSATSSPELESETTVEPEHPVEGSNGSSDETVRASTPSTHSSTAKGKGRAKDSEAKTPEPGANKKESNLVGKINNLASTDLNNITDGRNFLFLILYMPLQISLCIWFLYAILGWSAFVGMAMMVILFPVPGYIANMMQTVQKEAMNKTDARVQTVTETMGVLRMVKLFGWEPKIDEKLAEKRDVELKFIRKRQLLNLVNGNLNNVIPIFVMIATFTVYTGIMKEKMKPSTVFSSMAIFDMMSGQLYMIFYESSRLIQAKVSLDRVGEFLREAELLDEFAGPEEEAARALLSDASRFDEDVIGFEKASFNWSAEDASDGTATPSSRKFTLRIDDQLQFKRGAINLIIGPTGSGKTSLLMALLGEMHFVPLGPGSWYHLPRKGGVAYAAQESWVQNETIRDNILFGAPYDEARYEKVLHQCGLKRDLSLFEAGDKTEVGEKGLTLSGGQKARVTLARAIYSPAEIILLDDVLAALDVHTARWVVDKCFKGDLIRGRTILLVTHNVAMASPIAEYVVALSLDGTIASRGSVSEALAKDEILQEELQEELQEIQADDKEIDAESPDEKAKQADGKLILAEEVAEGHVSWESLKLFVKALGGSHVTLFWILFLGGMILYDASNSLQTWWMGYWAEQYDLVSDPSEVNIAYYLAVFCMFSGIAITAYNISDVVYVFGSLRASKSIHRRLMQSVLGTTLRWLDTTPTSRVIARCTQDIRALDGPVANTLSGVMSMSISMLIKLGAVVVVTPVFLIPGVFVFALGGWCGQIYMRAQIAVKREMSNAKAPVLGHFGAAIAGLTSIRAYGAQAAFREESYKRIDRYTRSARTFYNLNRWVSLRIDTLGGVFASALGAWLIYGPKGSTALPSNTGFSLTMAVGFSGMILWWVRILNEFEIQGNSLERILAYIKIEQEPKSTKDGVPPAYWPASGDLRVEKLSARYSEDGPKVLHDVSFHIQSGERVGVVGRTGSGKSSLTLALLRCIFTEGTVYYDGLPTSSVNLEALRSSITIIPQMPELLSGTLRENLDPFDQYDDATLNSALRAAGLFSLQAEDDESRVTLDSAIASGGGNLSVGQRQILALARAIVRGSKLLILDEATSAIDYETDTIIQSSLRNELKGDVTLITIAHRLQTIMDADKIMVLDAGRIVEFGRPSELLKIGDGRLRSLVDESGDKESATPLPLPIITTDADDDEILTAIAIAAVYFLWGVAFVLFVVATIRLYIAIETWCERRAAAAAASRGRSKPPSAWSQTKRFFKSWQKTRNWGGVSMEDGEREPLWNPSASTNSNVDSEEAGNR
ncbi:P-loop containing nucleoside triphosphate hydrolase protein [Auriscalpium vulgare]|uniref:P-loop containing nucleoside triphosphate hydrolase protein n=1 Tax=Auriscalpium vulgare TaxID=40419 RepID=A0ACB8S7N4_9AGAM|nr:P-loop containing nucleoside triphosphate hydrolase protein [Auriscalpium vulgare]